MLERDCISVLGIPIDNLTMTEAVDSVFRMIDDYKDSSIPRYIATVNVDFLTNTTSWSSKRSRHPELLDILRRADLVTADGMPVVWISRLMDSPLKERVAGSDMLPFISKKAAELKKSIFLFGARPGIADNAAKILMERYQGLKIAGTYSPDITTEGEAMLDSLEEDRKIVTMINQSGADILFIGLGNPKQEIWFNRNRGNVKVPVSIGVGGSFSFITGDVLRAPGWMQKNGLEWIYRIYKDPVRLWKRYFIGFFKLGFSILLPILLHKAGRLILKIRSQRSYTLNRITINVRPEQRAVILKMPFNATKESISDIWSFILDDKDSSLVIDFSATRHLDLYVMGFLVDVWSYCNSINKSMFMTGIKPCVAKLLKYNRLWDIVKEQNQDNYIKVTEQIRNVSDETAFSYATSLEEGLFKVELFGRLDAANITKIDVQGILESIGDNNCVINLKGLKFVDSTGLTLFIKIKKHLSLHNKTPFMCNASKDIMQIFNIMKLNSLFKVIPDFDSDRFLSRGSI
ncbi:MAG: WecB/TagA/CpsF family glycosyltransferase [Deltaproteobacteria bacterium]|nr:WecB/TagA/CpsF family glycosyltransferase [Deltaproteobacteria bacterium]